jgi:diadenosine tetraphosphatase ApaH/serine/threonine PP2A family protein phosphatase
MLIAVLTDLHANREALTACLEHAQQRHAERYAFLGDLVGYGADPGWVVDTVMEYMQRDAIAVLGNHDTAVAHEQRNQMHSEAYQAVAWTRQQLNQTQLNFLKNLPLSVEANGCLFVHASAAAPSQWEYITSTLEATRSLYATSCRITFCGHVHMPSLYNLSGTGKASAFSPSGDCSIPLGTQRHWLAIPGSVGQPRDGNPATCYAMFNDKTNELAFYRVPYDCETAAEKIQAAGLPLSFAQRLLVGR